MNLEKVSAFPLEWPPGWRRMQHHERSDAKFRAGNDTMARRAERVSVSQGVGRVLAELRRMNVSESDIVISSNLKPSLTGFPSGSATIPGDPGVAVYWRNGKQTRCMAIDRYVRVQDNLAAIAATLEAMRAIDRHGGAVILDRAFMGFAMLPAPEQWFQVLGIGANATRAEIEDAHRRLAMKHHPDRGGDAGEMARINGARDAGLEART